MENPGTTSLRLLLRDPLVDITEVQAVRGLKGRSVIDREISAGTWLEPVLWSSKCSRWQKSEVQALIDARVAGFDDGAMRVLVVTLRARRLALGARLKETSL